MPRRRSFEQSATFKPPGVPETVSEIRRRSPGADGPARFLWLPSRRCGVISMAPTCGFSIVLGRRTAARHTRARRRPARRIPRSDRNVRRRRAHEQLSAQRTDIPLTGTPSTCRDTLLGAYISDLTLRPTNHGADVATTGLKRLTPTETADEVIYAMIHGSGAGKPVDAERARGWYAPPFPSSSTPMRPLNRPAAPRPSGPAAPPDIARPAHFPADPRPRPGRCRPFQRLRHKSAGGAGRKSAGRFGARRTRIYSKSYTPSRFADAFRTESDRPARVLRVIYRNSGIQPRQE
jgi:hypothetical protein